jgi:hypothetical protein
MTIVGLAIVVVQLWREVGPLRAQVRGMRSELGLLNIDDPAIAQAIQLGGGEPDRWKWRIYLPPSGQYTLFVYSGMIPPRDFRQGRNWYDEVRQSGSGSAESINSGEFVLNVELLKAGEQWQIVTSRGNHRSVSTMSVDGNWLSQMVGRGVTSSIGPDAATKVRPGEPIHLMTLLEPESTKNGNTTTFSTPTGPASGIVVWIEQHSPVAKSATQAP